MQANNLKVANSELPESFANRLSSTPDLNNSSLVLVRDGSPQE